MSTRKLFQHQEAAVDFLSGPDGHLLAGEPGTGKTLSAIEACARMGARKILVTAPSIALTNWQREFTLAGSQLVTVDARRKPKLVAAADVVIMSVDWVRSDAGKAILHATTWDAHIADEAHRYKEPTSARTQAIYADKVKVGKTLFLTGTPTPTHAGNIWPHINRSAPQRIDGMTYDEFTGRYCITQMRKMGGMRFAEPFITGNNKVTIPDLRRRLEGWWLRQRKSEVLAFLPDKVRNTVDLPASAADLRAIRDAVDPEVFEALEFAVETGDSRVLSLMASEVATLRRLLAMTKVEPTVEYVETLMEDGVECLSVWGWHTEPLHRLAGLLRQRGRRVGLIDGGTSQKDRQSVIDDFQSGKIDVFVGQIAAAGIAVTLTRAARAVFMEQAFVPSDNEQAEDRHHRIGQKNSVQIDNLVLTGTIDEAVAAIVERRRGEYETLSKGA